MLKINSALITVSLAFYFLKIDIMLIMSLTITILFLILTAITYIDDNYFIPKDDLVLLVIKKNNLKKFNQLMKNQHHSTYLVPLHIAESNNIEIMISALKYEHINFNNNIVNVFNLSSKEMKKVLWNSSKIQNILQKNEIKLYNEMKSLHTQNKINNF
jgi:hypothetical protein